MMRPILLILALLTGALVGGCGEKDQSLTASRSKPDVEPWKGAHDPYMAKGWNPGDKAVWENQIRSRNQTQNEYGKIN